MIVRFDSVPAAMKRQAAYVAMAAALLALSGVASAQPGPAAPVASAVAPAWRVVGRYTVKPGQSLHDIAVELTQSHDKGVLARVSNALFEENPNAFSKHDPSRLKVGAVLNVPGVPGVLEAEPQAAASAPAPAPAVTAPAVASPGKVTAPPATAAASAPAKAPAQGASTVAAASAPVNAAVPGAATVVAVNPAATAAAPASVVSPSSAPSAAASAAVAASATAASETVAASGAAAQAAAIAASGASASAAASQPAAATSPSDAHVWSGAIQAAPAASAASGAAAAQGASAAQAPVTVSSLQQLLALKNRVLMALQKHGIGQSAKPAATGTGGAAGVAGAKVATGAAAPHAAGSQIELSPLVMSIVAAIIAALLALIVGLRMFRRKTPAGKVDKGSEAAQGPVEPPVLDTPPRASATPDESTAVEPRASVAPTVNAASATSGPAQRDEGLDQATPKAGLSAVTSLGSEALSPAQFDSPAGGPAQTVPDGRNDRVEQAVMPRGVERGEPETLADASEAAGFAAAAELGASALASEAAEAQRTAGEVERQEHEAEPEQAPHQYEAEAAGDADTPVNAERDDTVWHVATEPEVAAQQAAEEPQPVDVEQPAPPAVAEKDADVTGEFPPEAVSALGGIDMPLPPRVAEPIAPAEPVAPAAPLSTEPVASPETTAAKAVPLFDPSAPPVADAIGAGTAGPGAIAGLGAPRFGTLTLDFDLNLPPDSAEPLPVFTPEQLARIARNKLELAHEYIALGDLAGARSLINEVIESNDHGTRADAQALLSTLAPLS